MFLQREVEQVHAYLRQHPEVTDVLITGGDAGHLRADRLARYAKPIMEDPELHHIRTIRLGSRALSYNPEMILEPAFEPMLDLFRQIVDSGVQVAWMAHFSTPREVMHPGTIAAIRRLQSRGVMVRSQSPIMKHISLFQDDRGQVDVDRSAQNWIDLANLLGSLRCGFHSLYCARPTGEHQHFAAPLAAIDRVAAKIHRSLASIYRPSRYVSMTSSAGKISLLGTVEVGGKKAFALKFTQGRNMEWMDKVFLAKYDDHQHTIDKLEPFDTPEFFYREDQRRIEEALTDAVNQRMR
jgi:L-lysine 2,3-aminomutase